MSRSQNQVARKRKRLDTVEVVQILDSDENLWDTECPKGTKKLTLKELKINTELLGVQYRDTFHTPERTKDIKEFARTCWFDLGHDTSLIRNYVVKHLERCDVDDFTHEVDCLDLGHRLHFMIRDVDTTPDEYDRPAKCRRLHTHQEVSKEKQPGKRPHEGKKGSLPPRRPIEAESVGGRKTQTIPQQTGRPTTLQLCKLDVEYTNEERGPKEPTSKRPKQDPNEEACAIQEQPHVGVMKSVPMLPLGVIKAVRPMRRRPKAPPTVLRAAPKPKDRPRR